MCLKIYKDTSKPFIANEDIICYKFLTCRSKEYYHTPYMGMPVSIGSTYTTVLDTNYFKYEQEILECCNQCIGELEHGFHSFANIVDVNKYLANKHNVLVKCVIPKGSMYFVGIYDNFLSYASDSIKLVKKYNWLTKLFPMLFTKKIYLKNFNNYEG